MPVFLIDKAKNGLAERCSKSVLVKRRVQIAEGILLPNTAAQSDAFRSALLAPTRSAPGCERKDFPRTATLT